ncbi:TetR/AcrR family transcriptional regulator [Hyalangium versicolor]|uniref:TetR/AcrR family transcriptional regulator n=1 Tax=Hyalangium versicolor TaxID=2861190 RepID=UPI001CCDDC6C|nr:TetR/AcrR family transcriptional regulator [Hyalangium versicolor]
MPLARFEKLEAQKQARLLDAATEEFARHGYEEASLNRILEEAGFSKGALYYYFADKDDLYATVLIRAIQEMFRDVGPVPLEALTAENFWEQLGDFTRRWSQSALSRPTQYHAFRSFQGSLRREAPQRFASVLAESRGVYQAFLRRGKELGCVRDDLGIELLTELLEALDEVLDAAFLARSDSGDPEAILRHMALVVDSIRRLLAPASELSWRPAFPNRR